MRRDDTAGACLATLLEAERGGVWTVSQSLQLKQNQHELAVGIIAPCTHIPHHKHSTAQADTLALVVEVVVPRRAGSR